ncbi:MAG: PTPA-CTERM sorting domain-containing protein [Syntrophothermus sp.]
MHAARWPVPGIGGFGGGALRRKQDRHPGAPGGGLRHAERAGRGP